MRSDKKSPLKSDKKSPPKIQKKGTLGYNKKSALLEDAITQMNAGKYGRASSALKDLLALDPLNAEARRLFATLHLRLGSLMSARTAFESLAREAMERQDYWLAESLLREYLTAGPRCVPFLEMLGHVYEEKGDGMAAVAEYGKAVEVLLEDPDNDHPQRASELFGRIRSIAPGSPVAFRFAAMFDTVTGQILQTPSQPAGPESRKEPVIASRISESTIDSATAVVMPWEQMESTATDATFSLEAPITGAPIETKNAPAPLALTEPATEIPTAANAPDSAPADSLPMSEIRLAPDSSFLSSASWAKPDPTASQNEARVADQAQPVPTVAGDPKPALEVLTQGSSQPITEKPMSWDQVEDNAPAAGPAAASECSETTEVSQSRAAETPSPVHPASDIPESSIKITDEGSRYSTAESMAGPALQSLPQDDEVIAPSSPQTNNSGAIWAEVVALAPGEPDLPVSCVVASTSSTIEISRASSAQSITEPPVSPAPMPSEQIKEMSGASSSTMEPAPLAEVAKEAPESARTSPPVNAGAVADSPAEPVSSVTPSLGLSWDDILAAVTAMQFAPNFPPRQPITECESTADAAAPDEKATTVTPQQDSTGIGELSVEPPLSDTVASLVDNSPLSAPMPWEQIQIDDVAILRPDPEPEFGPVSEDVADIIQDKTVVMPLREEMHDQGPAMTPLADEVVQGGTSYLGSSPVPNLVLLSTDAPVEPPQEPLPIHIPRETLESVEETEAFAVPLAMPSPEAGLDVAGAQSLPLVDSEASGVAESDEAELLRAELGAEAVGVAHTEMPLTSGQLVVDDIEASLLESTDGVLSKSSSPIDPPLAVITVQDPPAVDNAEPMEESVDPSDTPSFVPDQLVFETEPTVASSEIVHIAENIEPETGPGTFPLLSQRFVSIPDREDGQVAIPLSSESDVSVEQASKELSLPVLEPLRAQSTAESVSLSPWVDPYDLTSTAAVSSAKVDVTMEAAEVPAPAVTKVLVPPAAPDASAEDGPHILWDDSSSKSIPSVSIGNMLTRWLKRPAGVSVAETRPTAVREESESLVELAPVNTQDAVTSVADRSIDQSADVPSPQGEQFTARPKPGKVVVGLPWRQISRAATSLIGAGVSTTRAVVVLVMAGLSFTAALLAGCLGVIALTWLMLEEQPTPAYRTMTSMPQRALEDSQKNGYFLLLGFGAPPTQDPVQAGIDRRVDGADRSLSHTCLTGEGNVSGAQQGASAEVAGKWLKSADPAVQMRVEATGVKSWVSQAGVAMSRYRQWLSKPFEDWGYGQPVSPNCGLILYAHRLYVAEGFAQDVEAGIVRLETDLTAWRTVFGQAKTMPVKMLASDALNDDIAVMSGLLLRPNLDDRLISRLAKLARPLDQREQSIRWPMQSQFVLATKTLDEALGHDPAAARSFYGSVAAAMPLPKQRRFNAYAQYYEAVGKAAAEGPYAELPKQSQFMRMPPYGLVDVFVNPIESLAGIEPLPTWEAFAGRVLETDARLRLASLQAWLRRTQPEQDLLTRVAKAGQGLYDPFTGYPMLVNMKKGVLYSVGRDMKDDEAQDRIDIVAQIPPTAWAGAKRTADLSDSK